MTAGRRYLTVLEAAPILGVAPSTLVTWAKKGYVPGRKTPGGHWRFFGPDLELALSAVNSNRNGPASQRKNSGPHSEGDAA